MSNLNATEYWIETSKNGKLPDLVFDKQQPSTKNSLIVHVIEYSAYQTLLEQAERMASILQEIKANKNANRGDWHRAIDGLRAWQEFKK